MPIVYQITCKTTGKLYVGWTTQSLARRFRKHCRNIRRDSYLYRCIQEYGADNFHAVVLFEFASPEEAIAKEVELIAAWKLNVSRFPDGNGMNMTDGGEGTTGYRHDEGAKEIIKRTSRGRRHSEATRKLIASNSSKIHYVRTHEHKAKISAGLKAAYAGGRRRQRAHRHTEETKRKMSNARLGKKLSPKSRILIGVARQGKRMSDETKQKLREANLGKKQSAETIEKRVSKLRGRKSKPRPRELNERLAAILRRHYEENGHPMRGRKFSEEAKANMRAARLAYLEKQKGKPDEQ